MKRKIVRLGPSTLVTSLPPDWIRRNKLGKGAEINVEEAANKLVISPTPIDVKTETEITLRELTETAVKTLITNTYRSGYDIIKVNFDDDKKFRILNNVLKNKLIGFEIIKKRQGFCIIENVTEPSGEQFENIANKIFFNISELFDATRRRMDKPDSDGYEETEERITRYDNFCRRIISKRKVFNPKSEFSWAFLVLIVHGQREIYLLNKLIGKGMKVSPKTKELLEDARAMFDMIKKAYLTKDVALAEKTHPLEKKLIYGKAYSLLPKVKGKEAAIVYHIMSSIRRFYQANSPLMGVLIGS